MINYGKQITQLSCGMNENIVFLHVTIGYFSFRPYGAW